MMPKAQNSDRTNIWLGNYFYFYNMGRFDIISGLRDYIKIKISKVSQPNICLTIILSLWHHMQLRNMNQSSDLAHVDWTASGTLWIMNSFMKLKNFEYFNDFAYQNIENSLVTKMKKFPLYPAIQDSSKR